MTRELFERLPGFCGHSVADAQAIRSRGTEDIELRLTQEELQKRLDEWCNEREQRPHQGLGEKTPLERWAESPVPVKKIDDIRALDLLLAETPDRGGMRVVQKQGIQIDKHFYADRDGEWCGHRGQRVKVKFDPFDDDAGEIYVFKPGANGDDQFLFVAAAPQLSGQSRREMAIAAREVERSQFNPEVREYKKLAKAVERTSPIVTGGNQSAANVISLVPVVQPVQRQEAKVEVTVVPFQRSQVHECAALSEASRALALLDEIAANRVPAELTKEEIVARGEQARKIEEMRQDAGETDAIRYSRLWNMAENGQEISVDDEVFMCGYEKTRGGSFLRETLERARARELNTG